MNRWTILWAALIVGFETALILVLLSSLRGRHAAERKLQRSQEQFALAVDGANDGVWDWDLRSGTVYYSDRCKRMLGYENGELANVYASWSERIHPDDADRVSGELDDHIEGSTPAFHVEHRLRHRDGGYRWILARGKAQRDAEGRAYRMAGSLTDITDLKRAEEGVRDVSRRLIAAQEEERARLARELHDDVTQRLARLAIDVGRLEQNGHSAEAAGTLRRVREEITHLSEDVHALSYRLHPSLLEDLGLAEALQVECDGFMGLTRVPARFEATDVPDVLPPTVAICLYRIAQEALRNVARHSRARTVELSLQGYDGGVQLAVRDDGVGFDPAAEPFVRSLGHASMRERVKLVDGEIDIESAPGHGTMIVAWVPLPGPRA